MALLSSYIDKFKNKKILVYGDVMLDLYIRGDVERISPEAPVPVIVERSREYVLGGAGNVAANIASLGGVVTLVGVVGNDAEGKIIHDVCAKFRIDARLIVERGRPTAVKARAVAKRHQLLRIDRERAGAVSKAAEEKIISRLKGLKNIDAVVVSDYAKGCVVPSIIAFIKKYFWNRKIIAGIKPAGAALYENVETVVLNLKEGNAIIGMFGDSDAVAADVVSKLSEMLKSSVVLTRGEYGITALDNKSGKISHIPTRAVEVYDVTGAGDTVLASLALMCASGAPLSLAAEIANHAAGVVVGLEGTATLTSKTLKKVLDQDRSG
ncbi:MAG: PfkB family carbohydrate kinase [Patescibacteria group bacterium]